MNCPKCKNAHPGPRSVEQLHAEGCGVLIRAHHLSVKEAGEYLRSQWMGGALELGGWCASCAFTEIAATSPGLKKDLDKVAQVVVTQTPSAALVEREYGEVPLHICKVIPMPRRKERVARDLLDIGSPKPGDAP